MIVSFSGRKQVGKTTLANFLIKEKGFVKISFADELKNIACELYDLDRNEISNEKYKEAELNHGLQWNDEYCNRLKSILKIDFDFNYTDRWFSTRREMLQFLGTEILRQYDEDFHVNSIKKIIENNPDINYVLDDTRFKNEISLLKNNGATCIYVIRPDNIDNYSNHSIEIDIRRKDVENILFNDVNTVDEFVRKFEKDYLSGTKKIKETNYSTINHDALYDLNFLTSYYVGLLSGCDSIMISPNKFTIFNRNENVLRLLINFFKIQNGYVKIGDMFSLTIESKYIVNDLKYWNIDNRKSQIFSIPEIIK